MIKELVFEGPINNLSLGNVSINLIECLYKKGIKVHYLPIGQTDIGNYNLSDDFKLWLQSSANNFCKSYKRDLITLKNWHIQQSWHFPTDKRYLLTYHELDTCSQEEINIVRNINKVFFCGNYSPKVFGEYSLENIDSFNLGFDQKSFYKKDKVYFNDGRIQWHLGGKAEHRKHSLKILALWAKKYGKKQGESYKQGEQQHFLNAAITNPFYDIKAQEQQIAQVFGGQRYINIQFFPFLNRESLNDLYNASHIDLSGLSGGESWNLVSFNFSCLGKWAIVLNCSGMKTWVTKDNCILVNPSGKVDATDNIFFHKGSPFGGSGNFYTFDDNEVIAAMELAEKKAKTTNLEGEKLKTQFTYEKSLDEILTKVEVDLNK